MIQKWYLSSLDIHSTNNYWGPVRARCFSGREYVAVNKKGRDKHKSLRFVMWYILSLDGDMYCLKWAERRQVDSLQRMGCWEGLWEVLPSKWILLEKRTICVNTWGEHPAWENSTHMQCYETGTRLGAGGTVNQLTYWLANGKKPKEYN